MIRRTRQAEGFPDEHLIVLNSSQREHQRESPLSRHLFFTDIGHFPRAANHYVDRQHGSAEFVIQFCLEGTGFCSFGGQKTSIRAHQYFVLPPHIRHAYGTEGRGEWKVAWIHFSGDAAGELAHALTPDGFGRAHAMQVSKAWFKGLNDISQSLKYDQGLDNIGYNNSRIWAVLSALVYRDRVREIEAGPSAVEKAIRFMQRNVNNHISLPEIADSSGLSVSRLSMVFREQTGAAPKEYFLNLKMKRACTYLSMTQLPVKDIATNLAFQDPYYFSRCFKQRVGISPLKYRKRQALKVR